MQSEEKRLEEATSLIAVMKVIAFLMASLAVGEEDRLAAAKACLESLRASDFNVATEAALASHAFVVAAEAGTLDFAALKRFAGEQRRIQPSDAVSFARLAGFDDWRPSPGGLTDSHNNEAPVADGLFGTLLAGEMAAAPLLNRLSIGVGLDLDAHGLDDDGVPFLPSPVAQAYGAYWALLSRDGKRAAAAAAAAVNFPAWGRACGRVHDAILKNGRFAADFAKNGVEPEDALKFLAFFAAPLPGLDDMAAAVVAAEFEKGGQGAMCEALAEPVRMLQAYELAFWDAVFRGP